MFPYTNFTGLNSQNSFARFTFTLSENIVYIDK